MAAHVSGAAPSLAGQGLRRCCGGFGQLGAAAGAAKSESHEAAAAGSWEEDSSLPRMAAALLTCSLRSACAAPAGGGSFRGRDDEDAPRRMREEDMGPSRAEMSDNWGKDRKFEPSAGGDRGERSTVSCCWGRNLRIGGEQELGWL